MSTHTIAIYYAFFFCIAGRISPSRIAKKHTTVELERQKTLDDGVKTKQWYYKYRATSTCRGWDSKISRAIVPTTWPSHPEACLEARKRAEARVVKIGKSIDQFGVQVTKVVLLVWLDDLAAAGLTLDQLDFTLRTPPVDFHTIAGDHTCASVQRKHAAKPNDPEYSTIPVEIICCAKTAVNIYYGHLFGELDNLVDELAEGATAWSIVVSCHSAKALLDEDPTLDAKQKKAALKEKLDTMQRLHSEKYAANSFGSLRALAMRTGKLWDIIYMIFDGVDLPTKKGERRKGTPTLGHFFGMASIPEAELTKWAENVLHQMWTTKEFSERCDHYKKVLKVTTQIVEYINSLCAADEETHNDFDAIKIAYPIFADDQWFTQLVSWCGKESKKPLNVYAKDAIQKAITAQKQKALHASQSSSSSSFTLATSQVLIFCWLLLLARCNCLIFS